MPPAVIGGVIAGVGAIGSAVIGSKAASKAAGAQADASAAQAKVQKDIYDKNVTLQQPWMNTGLAANSQINALLGLNVPVSAPAPTTPATNSHTPPFSPLSGQNMALGAWRQKLNSGQVTLDQVPEQYRQYLAPATPPPAAQPPVTQPTAQSAFDQFKNYTGYTSRLNEGQNAINSAYAAKGTLQSGAALQALQEHGQQFASGEFGKYMGYLGNQQQVGVGATNALSGVGTNYANAMSNIYGQQGDNAANAAIAKANILGGAMNGLAGAAGTIFGSSYGGGGGNYSASNQALLNSISNGIGGSNYSDRRLKRNIERIGEYPNGLGKYRWVYKFDPSATVCEGAMADEVKVKVPEAYSEDANGYGMVNYAKLGVAA